QATPHPSSRTYPSGCHSPNLRFGDETSVPEMPLAGQDHGQALLVGRRDDLFVADRSAGLDDRGGAGVGRRVEPVAEGEEGVAGAGPTDGPPVGLLGRDAARVATVLLSGADADRLAILDQHDGVRGHAGD